ncbi:hypothetical protein ACFVYA_30115 [Amycolatopsis sp. NPDC058278]
MNACRAVLLTEGARERIAGHPVTGEVVDELMRFDGPAFRGSLRHGATA